MENPTSPNRIPRRTSSAGFSNPQKSKSVLNPLPEDDWLGRGKKANSHARMNSGNSTNLPGKAGDQARRIGGNLIHEKQAPWAEEKERILLGPFEYLFGHPGKDVRSQLIAGFNAWLSVPEKSLKIITKVVGMLHTASLLIDDVEDSSVLRRGVPVAHSIFGTAQTINSANYVYFCALQELQKLNNPEALHIYTEELMNLHRGQGLDLFWRDTLTCPTEDDYLEMVNCKTGGLFRLAVKLMQCESNSDKDCVPLVNTIGLLFQILDDYKNLSSTTYTRNKGLAEDLTEGKFSFPIIHAIRADASNMVLSNILKQKTNDLEVKRYAISYMEKMGSFKYTRNVLDDLRKRALKLVDDMDKQGEFVDAHSEQKETRPDSSSESTVRQSTVGLGTGIRFIVEKLRADDEDEGQRAPAGS